MKCADIKWRLGLKISPDPNCNGRVGTEHFDSPDHVGAKRPGRKPFSQIELSCTTRTDSPPARSRNDFGEGAILPSDSIHVPFHRVPYLIFWPGRALLCRSLIAERQGEEEYSNRHAVSVSSGDLVRQGAPGAPHNPEPRIIAGEWATSRKRCRRTSGRTALLWRVPPSTTFGASVFVVNESNATFLDRRRRY